MPSMNTHDLTLENWLAIAWTNWSVNRAKLATEPEMSATTMISGFEGCGWRNFGSAGTPPEEGDARTVLREARGPRCRRRRRRARLARRVPGSGVRAPFKATAPPRARGPSTVVGAPAGGAGSHPGDMADRGRGQPAQRVGVHVHQGAEEHLGQRLAPHLSPPPPAATGFARQLGPLVGVGVIGVDAR